MATSEEKQELVEAIKGPRYYRITVSGYGGESAYMSISKEAHDFWAPLCEEEGDTHLVDYMLAAEDGNLDDMEVIVPPEAMFLEDPDGDGCSWYESHSEFEHTYGVEYSSARIDIDEVDSAEYSAKHVTTVFSLKDVSELNEEVGEETDWEVELLEMGCCDDSPEGVEYVAQMYSSEKGCFFDGVIETVGDFNPRKLKIYTTEFLNGEDTITSIEYDGVEVDNGGGDTNGKGFSAAVWKL